MTAHLIGGDACDCEPMPVNFWRLPDGSWYAVELTAASDGAADAEAYRAAGATAWVIACPECHRIYAGGSTPP